MFKISDVSKKYERGLFFERFLNYLWCKFHINNFSIVSVTRASFDWEFGGFLLFNFTVSKLFSPFTSCDALCSENEVVAIVTKLFSG